jgi:DNA ligase (NAD+)
MEAREFFVVPNFCPICSGPTSLEGDFLFCRSKICPARLSGSVKVWINRLGLLQWGDALINTLTNSDNPKVESLADLYRLSVDDIASCCSGQKVAKKCYEILHSNKNISLELLLSALNIPNLGTATATDIVHAGYDTIEKLLSMGYDELLKIPNIGEITARQAFDGIQERREIMVELSQVLDIRESIPGPLKGASFCITGSTSKPRKAVQKSIMDAGGIVKDSVGQGLTYLVTNEDASWNTSKMQKAKKYLTRIISESELYKMMGQN